MTERDRNQRIEREAVKQVRQFLFAPNCVRTVEAAGDVPDRRADLLDAGPGLLVKVIGRRRLAAAEWMRDAEAEARDDETPIVLMREHRDHEFLVMVRIGNVFNLAGALAHNVGFAIPPGEPDLKMSCDDD